MGTEAGGDAAHAREGHGRPEAGGGTDPLEHGRGAQACQHIDFRLRAPKPTRKTLLRLQASQLWFCPRSAQFRLLTG